MPRRARLSIGRNNGNNTWTLNDREIDTVEYVPPAGEEHPAELSLRVIAMPGGDTVALLDVPAAKHADVSAPAESSPEQPYAGDDAASNEADAPQDQVPEHAGDNDNSLSGQAALLTKVEERAQARVAETLAAWEREAANALKDAEKVWKSEEAERFAVARAQWQEANSKAVAETRARQDLETALADAQGRWKTTEADRRANDDLQWQKRLDGAVADALAEAETRWQSKFDAALTEARAEAATHLRTGNEQLQQLRNEAEEARSTLAQRDADLTAARAELEQLHAGLERTLESALQQAGAKWKAGEAARRAEAEAQWRAQMELAVAEALSSAGKARDERMQSELERLNSELSAARASFTARSAELTELQSAFARAQTDWQHEKESALSGAENAWRAAEAARLTIAKAEWQAQSDRALAEARAQIEAIRAQYSATDGERLREKLAERENELAQVRAAFLEERARLQQDAAEQLVEAEKIWKLDEIARMTQAREQWQAQTAKAVAEAVSSSKPAREMASDIELRRLRAECTALQAALVARESELKRVKQAAGDSDEIILRPNRIRAASDAENNQKKRDNSRKRVFGLTVAVAAGAASVGLFLHPGFFDDVLQPAPQAEVPAADAAPAPAPQPAAQTGQKHAVLLRGANVRAAPSGDASVMLTLPRGTEVTPLERQGNWTRIQIQPDGKSAASREGWVFTSFLKDSDGP